MNFTFDVYDRLEQPAFTLCEVGNRAICSLYAIHVTLSLRYTNSSEVSFQIPYEMNGEKYKYYDDVVELRLVHLDGIGYFQIIDIAEISEGKYKYKQCVAYSVEEMLSVVNIQALDGEYYLYNPLQPSKSVMHIFTEMYPQWSVGSVDGEILTRQRTLDIDEADMLSLLRNDFYTLYSCIAIFDIENYEINLYDAGKVFPSTDIYLSMHNLIKTAEVSVETDKIITVLDVYGGDGLDISAENPTGSARLYNLSYFKPRMSQGTRDAYEAYEAKYQSLQTQYSNLLVQLKTRQRELAVLIGNAPAYTVTYTPNIDNTLSVTPALSNDSGLNELEGLIKALDEVKAARIQMSNTSFNDVNSMMNSAQILLNNKNTQ